MVGVVPTTISHVLDGDLRAKLCQIAEMVNWAVLASALRPPRGKMEIYSTAFARFFSFKVRSQFYGFFQKTRLIDFCPLPLRSIELCVAYGIW